MKLGVSKRRSWRRYWWLLALVPVVVLLAGYIWYRVQLRPAGQGPAKVFVVASGQTAPIIATNLAEAKLIRNRNAFITYLNLHGLRTKIKAGAYSLSSADSSSKIASSITTVSTLGQLVIPEGYTLAKIEAAAQAHGISAASFRAALAEPHSQAGLSTKPAGQGLEGYLFPDSYVVTPTVTTASALINNMLDNFTKKVGTTYDGAFAAEGLTRHQGLTLASIVEREVSKPEDRPIVAQVFLKRLKLGMPLGSDVTVDYAAALLGTSFSTTLNSPYNTYLHAGLPPGPISNPGLSALDAVAHPAATDYLYFLAGKDGTTHFATTYAEHQKNVAKYLN